MENTVKRTVNIIFIILILLGYNLKAQEEFIIDFEGGDGYHPLDSTKMFSLAFRIPMCKEYELSELGAKIIDSSDGGKVKFALYNNSQILVWQSDEISITGGINEYVSVEIPQGSLILEAYQFYYVAIIGAPSGTNGIRIDAKANAVNSGTATNMTASTLGTYNNIMYSIFQNPMIIDIAWYGAVCLTLKGVPIPANDPVPDVADLPDLTGVCFVNKPTAPTATALDLCSQAMILTGTTNTVFPVTNQGTTVITWNYYNGVTQEQNIIIEDNIAPEISCIGNQNINLSEDETTYIVQGIEFDPLSIGDNCQVSDIINDFNNLSTLSGAELPIGSNIITWEIEDEAGNISNCTFYVVVNGFVGVENNDELVTSLYPNPVSDILIINMNDFLNNSNVTVEISDITGKIIYKSSIEKGKTEIDLSLLVSGIYLLKIKSDNEVFTTKIVKE